jgi:hypothetical protein
MIRSMSTTANALTVKADFKPFFRGLARSFAKLIPPVVACTVGVLLVLGWLERDEEHLTPQSGLGYWLGIYGSLAMLLLIVYSLRKRVKSARALGSIPLWFRLHMTLGVAGPVLVIFHANFKLGSLNSNVAFLTMLTVAMSGVVGRYLYAKIHKGLYGSKAEVKEILDEADSLRQALGQEVEAANHIAEELHSFSKRIAAKPPTGVLSSLWSGAVLSVQARWKRNHLLGEAGRLIRVEGKRHGWSWRERRRRLVRIRGIVRTYFSTVLKAAELAFFERLFGLWHVLHLPLFIIMLLAGVVHVWAVHHY